MRRWAKYGPQENQRCFLKKPWIIPFELVFFFIADLWKTWTVHEKFWKTWLPPFFSPLVYYIIFDVSYAKFNLATCSYCQMFCYNANLTFENLIFCNWFICCHQRFLFKNKDFDSSFEIFLSLCQISYQKDQFPKMNLM